MPQTVLIRPLAVDDAPAMAEVLSAPSLHKFIGGELPSAAQLDRRYTAQVRD